MASSDMSHPYRSQAPPRLAGLKHYVRTSHSDLKRSIRPPASPTTPTTPKNGTPGYTPGAMNGEKRQSWLRWAGQKVADKVADKVAGSEASMGVRTERLRLFPGWAARKYHEKADSDLEPYDIEVYISGAAVKEREFGVLTRSQKAVVKIAKSFAALPKVDGKLRPGDPILSRSTEDLIASMELPPPPEEMDVDSELRILRHHKLNNSSSSSLLTPLSEGLPSPTLSNETFSSTSETLTPKARPPSLPPRPPLSPRDDSTLKRLHRNLETRLQPFWAAALPARTVRICVYAPDDEDRAKRTPDELELLDSPIMTYDVITNSEGAFSARFTVPWEELCKHPRGIHIAFSPSAREDELRVHAELLPATTSSNASTLEKVGGAIAAHVLRHPRAEQTLPLSHSQIRVISDIDDTVKLSNILSGARAVFYNVFVQDLRENVIRGMGEFYQQMWTRGVRFHYVSNGPFELLPVIQEFLGHAQLPPGSIRLRLYSTRTLFNGLLSAPAVRKRAGVEEVLTSFPASRFILVGDSGEQDLELYAEQAQLRPEQILAVYIRDANTYEDGGPGISDPTGDRAITRALNLPDQPFATPGIRSSGRSRRNSAASIVSSLKSETRARSVPPSPADSPVQRFKNLSMNPRESISLSNTPTPRDGRITPIATPRSSIDSGGYFTPSAVPFGGAIAEQASGLSTEPGTYAGSDASSSQSPTPVLSESEKKRQVLQSRVWMARLQMPGNVVLRVFREPEECIEVEDILDRYIGRQEA